MPRSTLVVHLLVVGLLNAAPLRADDWPQWQGPKRDGIWRETGIVEVLPKELSFKWRTPIGAGYAGPAVANGKVYVTDRLLNKGAANPENPFAKDKVSGVERILCLDSKSGEILWKHEYPCDYTISYPAGPRATPTIHDGLVYSLGAMGNLFCLDADSGKVVWEKNFVEQFGTTINTWGMSAAPLVDGDRLILLAGGMPDACVIGLDRKTGTEIWRALSATDPGYAPPMIFDVGGTRQLIIWTPEALAALNPETGKTYWSQPFAVKAGLSIPTPAYDSASNLLLVSSFYNGSLMVQLSPDRPEAKPLWRGKSSSEIQTDGLHSIMCSPVLESGHIYCVCSYGQLRCLEAQTGKRVWETYDATGEGRWWNAFLIRHQDRFFLCNEQGQLILAKLSPAGYSEIGRAFLIKPTNKAARRNVVWSHPAFADRCVFARNDEEIVCADLSASGGN